MLPYWILKYVSGSQDAYIVLGISAVNLLCQKCSRQHLMRPRQLNLKSASKLKHWSSVELGTTQFKGATAHSINQSRMPQRQGNTVAE